MIASCRLYVVFLRQLGGEHIYPIAWTRIDLAVEDKACHGIELYVYEISTHAVAQVCDAKRRDAIDVGRI